GSRNLGKSRQMIRPGPVGRERGTTAVLASITEPATLRCWRGRGAMEMDDLDRRLLKEIQESLPVSPTPYAAIAATLGIDEATALQRLQALRDDRIIRQINAIFDTRAL